MSANNSNFVLNIEQRKRGSVAVLSLNLLPPNNTFNRELQKGFLDALADAAGRADVVVINSAHEKFFSNGLDGKFLLGADTALRKETIFAMIRFFGQVVECPKPIIAELGGFTMAGGAVLALACDYRYMLAAGGRIGFSELAVGLPLPLCYAHGMHRVVRADQVRFMIEGAAYKPNEALEIGLVDGVAESPEALRKLVLKRADEILRLEPAAYLPTRALYRKSLLEAVRRDEDEDIRLASQLIETPAFENAMRNIAGKNA